MLAKERHIDADQYRNDIIWPTLALRRLAADKLIVTKAEQEGHYLLIAGERRWRAAQKAQLHEVPVVIRELSDEEVLEVAIIENVQRVDLNPVEEALQCLVGNAGLWNDGGARNEAVRFPRLLLRFGISMHSTIVSKSSAARRARRSFRSRTST